MHGAHKAGERSSYLPFMLPLCFPRRNQLLLICPLFPTFSTGSPKSQGPAQATLVGHPSLHPSLQGSQKIFGLSLFCEALALLRYTTQRGVHYFIGTKPRRGFKSQYSWNPQISFPFPLSLPFLVFKSICLLQPSPRSIPCHLLSELMFSQVTGRALSSGGSCFLPSKNT